MQYPAELRQTVVRKALAREMTQEEIARRHGVSKSCVQQWVRKARERGETAMVDGEKRARDWSGEERFAALVETHGMNEDELGAWCRRHALHTHELAQWRRDALAGAAPMVEANEARAPTKRLRQENTALRKELTRKDRALAETTALLVLQKKARLLWGEDEER
jgi:transposase-like protein